jgi:EAL domain-containing protein (putative c-di-GMP-specific phosphodiesterase class I)
VRRILHSKAIRVDAAGESAVQRLRALKAIGVHRAVDDLGVGYSSFSYLREFPVDALKVDRRFINDTPESG